VAYLHSVLPPLTIATLLRAALVNSIATDDRGWFKKIFEDFPKILKEVLSKPQRL